MINVSSTDTYIPNTSVVDLFLFISPSFTFFSSPHVCLLLSVLVFFCHFHPLDRGFYFTLSRVCLSFTALYLLPSSFPLYPLFSHLFLLASLAFLIKVLEGISSHLLLSPYSVPLLLSLSLPPFLPSTPCLSLFSLQSLPLMRAWERTAYRVKLDVDSR